MGDSKNIHLSVVEWIKGNQKMVSVAFCWQLLLPLSQSEFCKLLNDLKCSNYFGMTESSDARVFFPPAAHAQNFRGINLHRNKFWSQHWHLSTVEGNLSIDDFLVIPKSNSLLVNVLSTCNTIISNGSCWWVLKFNVV